MAAKPKKLRSLHAAILNDWPARRVYGPMVRQPIRSPRRMAIVPSAYSAFWGAGEEAAPAQPDYLTQAAQIFGAYQSAQDVRIKLEKAYTDLEYLKKLGPLFKYLADRKEAEIRALEEKLALQEGGEASTRVWRGLGYTASAIGIVILGVGAYRLVQGRPIWGG